MAHDQRPQKTRPLILASVSPRRRMLLKTFGIPFRVAKPRVSETHPRRASPARIVTANAQRKADDVARRFSRGVVLAADTIVVLEGRVFGKPKHRAQARQMLRRLSGRTHRVYTGVCTIDVDRHRRWTDVAMTRVRMRRLSDAELARAAHHLDKAGAYAVQDLESLLIDAVHGSLSNVIGLPLEVVATRLRQCGLI